jgi:hypothetical protein
MRKAIFICIILMLMGLLASCSEIASECISGQVIGEIRSGGGGLAVSLDKSYKGAVDWQGRNNVIELLNIPEVYQKPGTILFFTVRDANQDELGPVTADGEESLEQPLYGLDFSASACP